MQEIQEGTKQNGTGKKTEVRKGKKAKERKHMKHCKGQKAKGGK